jgi:hypothetical protein
MPRRSHREPRRQYHPSGQYAIRRALPELLTRVADPSLPEDQLSPVERAARAWRLEVLQDLGPAVTATKAALLDAAVGSKIILDSLDRYVFELATEDGLVSRKYRRAFSVVLDRMRVADGLARQLQTLGLDRAVPPAPDLAAYLARRPRARQAAQASQTGRELNGGDPTVRRGAEESHAGAEAATEA